MFQDEDDDDNDDDDDDDDNDASSFTANGSSFPALSTSFLNLSYEAPL